MTMEILKIRFICFLGLTLLICIPAKSQNIQHLVDEEYTAFEELYRYLHSNPELSLQEENTSGRMSAELQRLGFSVTEGVGGYGVVGVFENGPGPVIMVRSDMDALPIEEQTGVEFASSKTGILPNGEETYLMHACGHDLHMTTMIGTASVLTRLHESWSGTLIMIAQPAEEIGAGANAMIEDGLFEKFPRPDFALALHVNSALESGKVGIVPGYTYASMDEIRITVKGRGGHGAYPDLTVDPVVMASKLVLDLQTIISREISTFEPAVLSVGSIRSGSSFNIIPDEAELRLTLRTYKSEIRDKIIRRIREMSAAAGKGAGLPEEEWPIVQVGDEPLPAVYNSPVLAEKMIETFTDLLGEENVFQLSPVMYGEDFGMYGRVSPEIPILIYSLGAVDPDQMEKYEQGLIDALPSTHSSRFLPDYEPAIKTGVLTMTEAVLQLMNNQAVPDLD
jgi:amidohydrolase